MNAKSLLHIENKSIGLTAWIGFLLLPVVLASVLTGCLFRPALVRQTFAIQGANPTTNIIQSNGQAVLAIRALEVSPLFEGRSFVYRTGPDKYQIDPYAGFLTAPNRGLAVAIRSYLRNSGAFKSVVETGSQHNADTLLEIYVSELYGDFRHSGQPAAVLSIRMLFFDVGSTNAQQPFLEKAYVSRVPLQQKTAAALVAGWNQALAQTMAEVTSDLASARRQRGGNSP